MQPDLLGLVRARVAGLVKLRNGSVLGLETGMRPTCIKVHGLSLEAGIYATWCGFCLTLRLTVIFKEGEKKGMKRVQKSQGSLDIFYKFSAVLYCVLCTCMRRYGFDTRFLR